MEFLHNTWTSEAVVIVLWTGSKTATELLLFESTDNVPPSNTFRINILNGNVLVNSMYTMNHITMNVFYYITRHMEFYILFNCTHTWPQMCPIICIPQLLVNLWKWLARLSLTGCMLSPLQYEVMFLVLLNFEILQGLLS